MAKVFQKDFNKGIILPFTPYHFGPAGLLALPLYKRLDLPVFLLANVAVDVEVLVDMIFYPGLPVHKFFHTLIGAVVVGFALAFLAYPFRKLLRILMSIFKLNYQPTFSKMLIGAVLGSIFHVIIDAFCWYDVALLWPWKKFNRTYRILGENSASKVQFICVVCFAAAVILYLLILLKNRNSKNEKTA